MTKTSRSTADTTDTDTDTIEATDTDTDTATGADTDTRRCRILIEQGLTGCGTCKRTFYSSKAKGKGGSKRQMGPLIAAVKSERVLAPTPAFFLPLCLGYIFVFQFDRIIQSFTQLVCLSLLVRVLMPILAVRSSQFSILSSSFSQSQPRLFG